MVMIRTFKASDMEEIIKIWNRAFPIHSIDTTFFVKNVLFDVNFSSEGFFVCEDEHGILGFAEMVIRRVPVSAGGSLDSDKAYLRMFAVSDTRNLSSVGRELLLRAEEYARGFGDRTIVVFDYTPDYIIPGISESQSDYIELFKSMGYTEGKRRRSIRIDLDYFERSPEIESLIAQREAEGFVFSHLENKYIPSLLEYAPPGWTHRYRRLALAEMDYEKFSLIIYEGRVVGCAVFGDPNSTEERFGPYSVSESIRGRGLGKMLLYRTLMDMKSRGLRYAYASSTPISGAAYGVYDKFGFYTTDIFVSLIKE